MRWNSRCAVGYLTPAILSDQLFVGTLRSPLRLLKNCSFSGQIRTILTEIGKWIRLTKIDRVL